MGDLEEFQNKHSLLFPMLVKKDPQKDVSVRIANKTALSIRRVKLSQKYDLNIPLPTLPEIHTKTSSLPVPDLEFFGGQRSKTLVIEIPREQADINLQNKKLEASASKSSMNTDSNTIATINTTTSSTTIAKGGVYTRDHMAALSLRRTNTTISLPLNGSESLDTSKANSKLLPATRNKAQAFADVNSQHLRGQDLQIISCERSQRDELESGGKIEGMETKILQRSLTEISDKPDVHRVFGEYNSRLPHKLGSFEKLRDKQVYKRTRILLKNERELKDWPTGLELSGKSVVDDETEKDAKETDGINGSEKGEILGSDFSSALGLNLTKMSPRAGKVLYSTSYYSDFGLKDLRSDLFSGHKKKRKSKSASDTEMEKDMKRTAHRHIYACQVMSSIRKGSKAARGWSSLMETIGPPGPRGSSSASSMFVNSSPSPRQQHRPVINSPEKFFNDKKHAQIAYFIKTRESTEIVRAPSQKRQLPEINGRTMVLAPGNK